MAKHRCGRDVPESNFDERRRTGLADGVQYPSGMSRWASRGTRRRRGMRGNFRLVGAPMEDRSAVTLDVRRRPHDADAQPETSRWAS